jgi:hypothetical protein
MWATVEKRRHRQVSHDSLQTESSEKVEVFRHWEAAAIDCTREDNTKVYRPSFSSGLVRLICSQESLGDWEVSKKFIGSGVAIPLLDLARNIPCSSISSAEEGKIL